MKKVKKKMSRKKFDKIIFETFLPSELALINTNIYLNKNHIDYYENFHMEKYRWCLDYLIDNRDLLKIEHTPEEFKADAIKMIENATNLFSNEEHEDYEDYDDEDFKMLELCQVAVNKSKNKGVIFSTDSEDHLIISEKDKDVVKQSLIEAAFELDIEIDDDLVMDFVESLISPE